MGFWGFGVKRRSNGLDIDHTRPWEPTGRLTRPDNLGPLSRKVHRAKTFGGWQLTQPSPGNYLWRSPLGFGYLVTPSHSWMVEDPSHRVLSRQVAHDPAPLAA